MAPIDTPEGAKPKKEKKDKSAKKRALEEEAATEERKHKKSKRVTAASPPPEPVADATEPEVKEQKKKKKKKDKTAAEEDVPATVETPVVEDEAAQRKREKKEKKRRQKLEEANGNATAAAPPTETEMIAAEDGKKEKKKKKDKKRAEPVVEADQSAKEAADPDAIEIDTDTKNAAPATSNKIHQPSDIPSNPQFPFYKQTVSLYEPIFPNGWAKPITGCESQHLRHLRNRYVPSLGGVLLDYDNITLGELPGRTGAARDDESPALLTSKAEFGGAFGWMTADVKLFVPSRGAWMEGSVNLQTEGHIGVVCFGKFNASIEARRLPPSWKWVSDDNGVFDETASVVTGAVPDEHGVVRQIHSTGYWVDESGDKVSGKTRFRIRNFDVGISGDSTYLSLQGTMLDRESEKKLIAVEAKDAKERKARRGGKQLKRTVPDFSMTKFDYVEEEGQDQQQAHDVQQALELPEGADAGDLATEKE